MSNYLLVADDGSVFIFTVSLLSVPLLFVMYGLPFSSFDEASFDSPFTGTIDFRHPLQKMR